MTAPSDEPARSASPYREEREFVVRLRLAATFDDDYEGDDDGYAWAKRFDEDVRPALARAVIETLVNRGHYRVTPVSRGEDARDVLELAVEWQPRAPRSRSSL